ncbi:uncharacterized protein JCM6883_001129 [Sporobolomyces salmoneus]|uniref:uncharacterized protein n=1 Tax=Sporobolomyces salmoneus TaxID=183962 RepID=UPI003176CAA8
MAYIRKELDRSETKPSFLYAYPSVIGAWRCAYAIGLWRYFRYVEAANELRLVKVIIEQLGSETSAAKNLLFTAQVVANYPNIETIPGITDESREKFCFAGGMGEDDEDTGSEEETDEEEEVGALSKAENVPVEQEQTKIPALRIYDSEDLLKVDDDIDIARDTSMVDALDLPLPTLGKRKASFSPSPSSASALSSAASVQVTPRPLSPLPSKEEPSAHLDALDIATRTSSKPPLRRRKLEDALWGDVQPEDVNMSQASNASSSSVGASQSISFSASVDASPEEIVKVVGSIMELGVWNPEKGLPLQPSTTGMLDGHAAIPQLGDRNFEWKLVRMTRDGTVLKWERESTGNRLTHISAARTLELVVWED